MMAEREKIDVIYMTAIIGGRETDWVWVFAGPSHPKAIEQSRRVRNERANWATDDLVALNSTRIAERLLGWHRIDENGLRTDKPVTMAGMPYPFSEENARKLLADPRKGALLLQALEFLVGVDRGRINS